MTIMKISEIGESGIINRIRKRFEKRNQRNKSIVAGIGDDAAAVNCSNSRLLLVTTDTIVENVHFSNRNMSVEQIGRKAMVSNISDIAAMGGIPTFAVVSLAIPVDNTVKTVDNLYDGMDRAAKRYKVAIVGGDTVKSMTNLVITITLIGEVSRKHIVLRKNAKVGDKLLVTGTFGDSAAGLDVLAKCRNKLKSRYKLLIKKHQEPDIRLKEAQIIAENGFASAMIDSSDGLDVSVKTICSESNVGARVYTDRIPLSIELKRFCNDVEGNRNSDRVFKYGLFGGEEYELVFTVAEKKFKKALKSIPGASLIGEIVPFREGVKYIMAGKAVKIRGESFQHFR